ncbi:MMPL family transporter [Euryarchaeota archaeon]|nr:MMPL family transporter [Euryarchaeota archaeon]MDC3310859.1 MMPL family transporter [Candidatus Poseidoniales archaeon]
MNDVPDGSDGSRDSSISADDEVVFWERFFAGVAPLRDASFNFRDTVMSGPLGKVYLKGAEAIDKTLDVFSYAAVRLAELTYSAVLRSPGFIVALLLLSTALIGKDAMDFEQQINGDVEIYLPDGADSTELLLDVREAPWATDIFILYIQTNNAATGNEYGTENITDEHILQQLSWLEGDDRNKAKSGYQSGLDKYKNDRGEIDGVIWVLSPSQIIKEANSSSYRFNCAVEKYGLPTGQNDECTASSTNPNEGYSIPDEQERIDNLVDQTGSLLESFVRDTNNDGIWDTGVIVMGIIFEMEGTDVPPRQDSKQGLVQDHKAFIAYANKLIYEESESNCELCNRVPYSNPTTTMDRDRLDDIPDRKAVTITGLTPVLHDVSDSIYDELVDTMLPISGLLVCLTMLFLHRNPKVIIVGGLPIAMSLAVTFGIIMIRDIMLTPMIISAGPILVGLGVDYSLHLTNRIEENRVEIIEERLEKAWAANRDGLQIEDIDPWDPMISLTATVKAALTTGNAIFLSALTTIIGFSVLTWTYLVPIQPMRTVGTTLLLGIFVTFFFSMIMVPALVELLRYRKGPSKMFDALWNKIGQIPVRSTLLVLIVAIGFTIAGVSIFAQTMGQQISAGPDEVPPNLESYETLREYSAVFEGGQVNMFIVNAEERGSVNGTAAIRDIPILDSIEKLQVLVDNVPETDTISLVNILKAIHVDVNLSGLEIYDESLWDILHDECWDKSNPVENPLSPQCWAYSVSSREDMVNIAFDTLSPEIRSMLMNADEGNGETKTLVYANQPYINLADATLLRNSIDDILQGEDECITVLKCTAIDVDDTYNSLLTGGLPVSIDINAGIHKAQSSTTIWTMFILLITMAFLFRSPKLAIFTMSAVAVVVLWQPLLMRFGNVGVNVFTAMIGTIVFGIGVDDSIHIVDRIKDEGQTPAGIVKSVAKTGQTIFETTATTCAGLSAGLFVSIPGLQNFFVLMMVLLILALLASSILLPSIIVFQKEITSRIMGNGSWLDFEDSGSLESTSVLDAVIFNEN